MKPRRRPAASVGLDPHLLARQGETEIRSGDFASAERTLAEAAKHAPDSARIQHLLGVALHEQGSLDRAIACYRKALKLDAGVAAARRDLGAAYMEKRRYGEALGCYREAMRLDPGDDVACARAAEALRELGDIVAARAHFQRALWLKVKNRIRALWRGLSVGGRKKAVSRLLEDARRCFTLNDIAGCEALCRQLVAAAPGEMPARQLLGEALLSAGRAREARETFDEAARIEPGSAEFANGLAKTQLALGELDDARASAQRAVALNPSSAESQLTLAAVHGALGEFALAERHSREALRLGPGNVAALTNLGTALRDQGRIGEARASYEQASRLAPEDALLCIARGVLSVEIDGRIDEGIEWFRKARRSQPRLKRAEFMEAVALLLSGRFAQGWDLYEARKDFLAGLELHASIPLPDWDGSPLENRSIVLYGEQGLGDEIMFASCLPDVLRQAGACHLLCHKRLGGLFARSFAAAGTVGWRGGSHTIEGIEVPRADFKCAFGSLPRFLRRSRKDFPLHGGYLAADPDRVARWRHRLNGLEGITRVGVSWRGGVPSTGQSRRSLTLAQLEPILRTPGIEWISLQYTDCHAEIEEFGRSTGIRVHHWQEAIDDFEEHAALAAALDHRVSVCNTFVHLCGALGAPVWVLAPFVPEWRYGMESATMAWYPAVRLYRQAVPGQWGEVVGALAADLRAFVKHRPDRAPA